MKSKFLFTVIFLISTIFSFGQDQILMDASNSIKIDELKEKMYAYSSDEFEGRGTPSKGQQLAVEYLVDHYKNTKDNLLKPSTIIMLSNIYKEKKDYEIALDWVKKGEKIQANSYFQNLMLLEKAKILILLGKKVESKRILSSLLEMEDLNQRHKLVAEELISSNIG